MFLLTHLIGYDKGKYQKQSLDQNVLFCAAYCFVVIHLGNWLNGVRTNIVMINAYFHTIQVFGTYLRHQFPK